MGTTVVPMPNYDDMDEETLNKVKDVRAKLYWLYKPRNLKECKVFSHVTCQMESASFSLSVKKLI